MQTLGRPALAVAWEWTDVVVGVDWRGVGVVAVVVAVVVPRWVGVVVAAAIGVVGVVVVVVVQVVGGNECRWEVAVWQGRVGDVEWE